MAVTAVNGREIARAHLRSVEAWCTYAKLSSYPIYTPLPSLISCENFERHSFWMREPMFAMNFRSTSYLETFRPNDPAKIKGTTE